MKTSTRLPLAGGPAGRDICAQPALGVDEKAVGRLKIWRPTGTAAVSREHLSERCHSADLTGSSYFVFVHS
ncbi:hypothetical protein EH165_03990 [Nakamurella antarctica]|uniref:Uncharacterized protein n=1 Tax=Nakamurella antarctica TaxID=1902245 RepID=A0A3G8ZTT3_9ACTN|nr:hypothetical protein [Nakamurella antarctica]AZI57446.1 hypothetical protein EH165_03990 [Nakamurella antarctica]